jgi:hypothetical protein
MKPTMEGEEKTRGGLESSVLVGSIETRTKQVSIIKAKNSVNFRGVRGEFSHGWRGGDTYIYTCTSLPATQYSIPSVIQ